jgi:hypothetical protein
LPINNLPFLVYQKATRRIPVHLETDATTCNIYNVFPPEAMKCPLVIFYRVATSILPILEVTIPAARLVV